MARTAVHGFANQVRSANGTTVSGSGQQHTTRYSRAQNVTYQIPVTVPDITRGPVRAPAVPLQPGDDIEIWPLSTNTKNAYVGQTREAALYGPRSVFAAGTQSQIFNVLSLAELFVFADVNGEGVLILVKRK